MDKMDASWLGPPLLLCFFFGFYVGPVVPIPAYLVCLSFIFSCLSRRNDGVVESLLCDLSRDLTRKKWLLWENIIWWRWMSLCNVTFAVVVGGGVDIISIFSVFTFFSAWVTFCLLRLRQLLLYRYRFVCSGGELENLSQIACMSARREWVCAFLFP